MKRLLTVAALLATLLGGTASALSVAGQDGRDGHTGVLADTAWGGSCDLPLCKPLM